MKTFWNKVDNGGENGCWNWMGSVSSYGYGLLWMRGKEKKAHRISYELLVGKIPEGLYLDHLCRNRRCVNPSHLEAVTTRVNILRGIGLAAINAKKTHCIRGHEFGLDTRLVIDKRSGYAERVCRLCRNERMRNFYAKRRALRKGQVVG